MGENVPVNRECERCRREGITKLVCTCIIRCGHRFCYPEGGAVYSVETYMGENVPVSREDAAFMEWSEKNPKGTPDPYSNRHPDDIDIYDLKAAWHAGIEWAIYNVET